MQTYANGNKEVGSTHLVNIVDLDNAQAKLSQKSTGVDAGHQYTWIETTTLKMYAVLNENEFTIRGIGVLTRSTLSSSTMSG